MMTKKQTTPVQNNPSSLRRMAIMSTQIGFSVAISALVFVWGGRALDEHFGTKNKFTFAGILLGLFVSLVAVWNIVRELRPNIKEGFSLLKNNPKKK